MRHLVSVKGLLLTESLPSQLRLISSGYSMNHDLYQESASSMVQSIGSGLQVLSA